MFFEMIHYSNQSEAALRLRVDNCLKAVSRILDTNKTQVVKSAESVSHRYDDKFLLADYLTKTSISCVVNALTVLCGSAVDFETLKGWGPERSVSLMFERQQRCKFVRETERDFEIVTIETGGVESRVTTKVREFVYIIEAEYLLTAFSGVGDNPMEVVALTEGRGSIETTLRSHNAPFHESTLESFDVDISWLLTHLDEAASTANFSINRAAEKCATPRQNQDVIDALKFFSEFGLFCNNVRHELLHLHDLQSRFQAATSPKLDISKVTTECIFNPIMPLFAEPGDVPVPSAGTVSTTNHVMDGRDGTQMAPPRSVALPPPVTDELLNEQRRSLTNKCNAVAALFASNFNGIYGPDEAKLMVVLAHLAQVAQFYREGVDFIEHMIRSQLVAAVGKELTARDFAQYMTFHNRKVFKEAFQPKPFSYAVRRSPLHSPEGQIQIETTETTPAEPIYTVSQHAEDAPLMEFALNATTTVKFGGERHLHGWMAHRFSGQALPELKFVAEARQFSSYIVLIGRIASAKLFQPKYGFIVQNKDEFRIPLDLEQIPTAKEFKDAISSLSPEQQRFAKAFRSMQLESTLFGVCVIQIKPQLEKVLKLQADSLTKEIKLTQDLMQLFIKYQIPSDLLSFDDSAPEDAALPEREKRVGVKRNVQAMQEMVLTTVEEQIDSRKRQREFEEDPSGDDLEEWSGPFIAGFEGRGGGRGGWRGSGPSGRGGGRGGRGGSGRIGGYAVKHKMAFGASSGAVANFAQVSAAGPALNVTSTAPLNQQSATSSESLPNFNNNSHEVDGEGGKENQVDYTQYPNKLEEMYTRFDPEASLRPTIINPGATWAKRAQAGLLSTPQISSLDADTQAAEKNSAFDLLDALTRSGALAIEHASLHVIIAATHCFDQSLMDTVVQKNVNPIERVERSTLIMAATLNNLPASALITEGQVQRVATFSPMLFEQQESLANEV